MALWATRRAGALGVLAAVWLGLIGCSGGSAKPDAPKTAETQPDAGAKAIRNRRANQAGRGRARPIRPRTTRFIILSRRRPRRQQPARIRE